MGRVVHLRVFCYLLGVHTADELDTILLLLHFSWKAPRVVLQRCKNMYFI